MPISVCIHCREILGEDELDHWKTCPDHPAREYVGKVVKELQEASDALGDAWQMLDAICSSDPSPDRLKARDKAWDSYARTLRFIGSLGR